MKTNLKAGCIALGLLAASASAWPAYPERSVRFIVPFPAGGPTDTAARTVAQALSKSIGQPVVVENKPGADGAIAVQIVLAAPPDGYTLLFASASMVALPLLSKAAAFDPQADFAPVAEIGRFPFTMFVNPDLPAKNVAEFIAYAKANPGKLNYATSNMTEYLAAAKFMNATGVRMVRVHYKGAAQAMPDLIAGRVQVNFGPLSGGLPYVKDGRLRALATLTAQRTALLPDLPTMTEAGVPAIPVPTWQAILGPAKTPREIVDHLSREVNLALQNPETRAQLERQAMRIEGSTPQVLAATVQADARAWAEFARDNAILPE